MVGQCHCYDRAPEGGVAVQDVSRRFCGAWAGAPCTRSPGRATYSKAWNASQPRTTPKCFDCDEVRWHAERAQRVVPHTKVIVTSHSQRNDHEGQEDGRRERAEGPAELELDRLLLAWFSGWRLGALRLARRRLGSWLARRRRARAPPADWRRVATISAACFWLLAAMRSITSTAMTSAAFLEPLAASKAGAARAAC